MVKFAAGGFPVVNSISVPGHKPTQRPEISSPESGRRRPDEVRSRFKRIERARDRVRGLLDVRIDHCGLQATMPEQQLDRSDIGARCQQVGSKRMPQAMNADMLRNLGLDDRLLERALYRRIRCVPAN